MATALTLERLNEASCDEFVALLDGVYEHSPWIAEQAWARRPFDTLAALKYALVQVLRASDRATRIALIRAHPELAGKAMVNRSLTAESSHEQGRVGPDELHRTGVRPAAATHAITTPSSAGRLRWPFAARVGRACAARKSSARSSGACRVTPTSSSPNACATSTGSPRSV